MDENDYEEPESDEEKRDAQQNLDSDDDEVDMTVVKLEVDEDFDVSTIQQKVQPNDDDIEQLEELERKEEEMMQNCGDKEIFALLAKFSANHQMVVCGFEYDKEKYSWVKVNFEAPIKFRNIDMTNIVREIARLSTIHEVPKLKRAFVHRQNDVLVVTTEGINIGVNILRNFNELNIYFIILHTHRQCLNTTKFSTSTNCIQTTFMQWRELMALKQPLAS